MLNDRLTSVGYLSGRLFALLEHTQEIAIKNVNSGIRDRYMGAASTRPATVFPLLLKLNVHHTSKIGGGLSYNIGKELEQIMAGFTVDDQGVVFPKVLRLEDQGLFFVGYYHQRAANNDRLRSEKKAENQ